MGVYESDAQRLLELVGGRQNIAAVTHCMTRMRFTLVDLSAADAAGVEQLACAKGCLTQGGQFQVVIGNDVKAFFEDFERVAGMGEGTPAPGDTKTAGDAPARQAAADDASAPRSPLDVAKRAMAFVAAVFAPLIPAIIAGGLILGLHDVLAELPLFEGGTRALADISPACAWLAALLRVLGEAVFGPGVTVGICWSVMKKMDGTPALGIALGLALAAGDVSATGAADLGLAAGAADAAIGSLAAAGGYQAQVLPALFCALLLGYLERAFRSVCPQAASAIVVPFCSLVLAVAAGFLVLAPASAWLGHLVATAAQVCLTGPARVLVGAAIGLLYAPFASTGLHHVTLIIDLQLMADFGGTALWPLLALSNIAQGSAALGVAFLQRRGGGERGREKARAVTLPAATSCYLGVTEPAVFGVNRKLGLPFRCACVGSAAAGALCAALGVTANAIGVGGLPGILSIQLPSMPAFAACMAVAVAAPFALTILACRLRQVGDSSQTGN